MIGQDLAKKLQHEFRGQLLPLACCSSVAIHNRNIQIQKAAEEGRTPNEIAERFNISYPHVQLILSKRKNEL